MNVQNLIRENIKNLEPYASARDEFKGVSTNMIFLDANENPYDSGLNRYPDPQQSQVKKSLAKQKGVLETQILLGNGSDEVLDLIFRVFCEPKEDAVITLPPTYGMYKVLAATNNVDLIEIPLLANFQPNNEAVLERQTANAKLLFLCSPNNPTANSFDAEKVFQLISEFKGIVVIDEAYIDFSKQESWVSRLNEFPNLIVAQTLSKAYGMAGIRLGIGYASEQIIALLNKVKPPYNVNQLTQEKALRSLNEEEKLMEEVNAVIKERERMTGALNDISLVKYIYPSDANFLLVKVDDADKRYNELIEKGIVVRNRSTQILCDNCLRFTIGTEKENNKLIKTLRAL